MVTIKDIAKMAGVTYVTVSKALNGAPGVNEKTRRRILDIAEQMNYVPNLAAKRMVNRKTNCIGLILPEERGLFWYDLSMAIHKAAAQREMHVISSMAPPEQAMRIFNQHFVDSILFWINPSWSPSLDFLKEKERFKGEMLLLGGGRMEGTHSLMVDRLQGIYEAVRHLAGLGHTRIAFVGEAAQHAKHHGFMQGVADFRTDYLPEYSLNKFDVDFEEQIDRLFHAETRPTAMVVDSHATTFQVIKLLRKLDIRIPEHLSLVAYDDVQEMEMFEVALTRVGPSASKLADRALEIITEEGSEAERDWKKEMMQPVLVIRESTRVLHK